VRDAPASVKTAPLGLPWQGLIFAAALLPRLAHFWCVRATPLAGQYVPDLSAYLHLAQKIVDTSFFFVQPMVMSPGYSLFIAPVLALLGPDIPALVLLNALLDAGSAALCAGLAASAAPAGLQRRAGLSAGLLYALCGPLVFYALLPLAEGPAMFCLLAALTLLFRSADSGRNGSLSLYLGGAMFALAALLRPNLAPAGPLLALAWCLPQAASPRRQRLAWAGRFLCGMLLTLLPFMAHNLALEGRPTPFGFQGGFTFYTGNFQGASGVGDSLPGFTNTPYLVILQARAEAARRLGRPLTLSEADAYWYGQGFRFFAEHPGQAARLLGKKALLLVNAHGQDATADLEFSRRFSPVPTLLALPLGVCFALAAVGLLRRARCSPEGLALAAVLAWGALSVVFFQVTPRYRSVLLPLALPFAGLALAELPALLRLPPRRALAPALLLTTVLGLASIPLAALVAPGTRPVQEHLRLARYYLMTGEQPLARAAIDAALALGAAQDARVAEELRGMRAASLALEGASPQAASPATQPRPAP
jgi:4-amino-4-deoxy-L-arabinose transferase-like glycosyltransferase